MGRYSNSKRETKLLQDLIHRAQGEHVEREPAPERARISKLPKAVQAEILERYQRGERPVDIAREYGISEWRVQDLRKRSGVARQEHGMSEAEIARAVRLHGDGLSFTKIGAAVSRDPKTIAKELRARGLAV